MADNSKTEFSTQIQVNQIKSETKEINTHDYKTPLEEMLLSGSGSLIVNGKERFVDSSSLLELMQESDTRKALLTPLNVTRGRTTLEEALRAREQIEHRPSTLALFVSQILFKHVPSGRSLGVLFKLGKLDENGQLTEFSLYPTPSNLDEISLSEIPSEGLVLNEDFKHVIEPVDRKNGALKFRIKSAEEIKSEPATKTVGI